MCLNPWAKCPAWSDVGVRGSTQNPALLPPPSHFGISCYFGSSWGHESHQPNALFSRHGARRPYPAPWPTVAKRGSSSAIGEHPSASGTALPPSLPLDNGLSPRKSALSSGEVAVTAKIKHSLLLKTFFIFEGKTHTT